MFFSRRTHKLLGPNKEWNSQLHTFQLPTLQLLSPNTPQRSEQSISEQCHSVRDGVYLNQPPRVLNSPMRLQAYLTDMHKQNSQNNFKVNCMVLVDRLVPSSSTSHPALPAPGSIRPASICWDLARNFFLRFPNSSYISPSS